MEETAIMMDKPAKNTRYDFLVPPDDRITGLYVHGTGTRLAPPNTAYQVFEEGAPYQWKHGRTMSDFGLVYLTEGGGLFRSRGSKSQRVKAGDLLVLKPGVWHDYFPDEKTGWREYWVTFNGDNAAKLLARLGHPKRTSFLRLGVDGTLCRLFVEMLEVGKDNHQFTNLALSGKALHLLAHILRKVKRQKDGTPQEKTLVGRARKHMENHFAEAIDFQDLAKSLHVSHRHFRRTFKASTGMPPHQYLLNLRTMHARRLLEEKDIKISALAKMVGFDDPYYFSRVFKSKTGIAPAHWRR